MPHIEHHSHKGLNNRAENSHVPMRKRERIMQRFQSAGALRRIASIFCVVENLFVPLHSNCSALRIQTNWLQAMAERKAVTAVAGSFADQPKVSQMVKLPRTHQRKPAEENDGAFE